VTAVVLGISLARDSQRLAFLALVGGFITPLLLNTGTDNEIGLFTYLAILNAGLLWVAQVRNWRSLPVAFLFTLVYAWSWYDLYYDPSKLAPTAFFAALFYVEFGILPAVSARRTGTLANEQLPLVLTNATWFTFAATDMLYAHHRLTLVILLLVLAAVHFIISRIAAPSEPPLARLVYEALSFTFIAVAIGVGLRGSWVSIGWSVQGAALVLAGLRGRSQILRMEGLLLFIVVVTRLVMVTHDTGRFIFNSEFGMFAVVVTCIGFASYRAYRQQDILVQGELVLYRAAGAVANMLAIWALSRELWNLDVSQVVRGCALAVLWTVYASVLVLVGNMRRSALFQWQGIILLAMAIACEGVNAMFSSDQLIARQTPWMAMLWACAGAAFVWRGVFWQGRMARVTGQLLLIVSALWVLILGIPGGALLFNARFGTLLFIIACYGVAVACGRIERERLSRDEALSYDVLAVAINAIALWALSDEIVSIKSLGQEPMQLLLTVLWTVYAAVLMLLGLRRKSAFLRWQSLALLGVVISKVFLFDLSVLPLGLRILSFLALGIVLMGVSFVYQRRLQAQRDKT
jgi:uncharacterized membrane protein